MRDRNARTRRNSKVSISKPEVSESKEFVAEEGESDERYGKIGEEEGAWAGKEEKKKDMWQKREDKKETWPKMGEDEKDKWPRMQDKWPRMEDEKAEEEEEEGGEKEEREELGETSERVGGRETTALGGKGEGKGDPEEDEEDIGTEDELLLSRVLGEDVRYSHTRRRNFKTGL